MLFLRLIRFCVWLFEAYLALGFLFACYFVTRAVGRIDPSAKNGSWGFRAMVFPGSIALWPLLLLRVVTGQQSPPVEHTPHKQQAIQAQRDRGEGR